ncbi:ankyrin repeat-containing domain protein [Aspergillus crustosus]
MSKKAPRIPDKIWARHKDAIISLYSAHTLEQTMEHMKEVYGFQASKDQYTTRLKTWGISKYHPGSVWAPIERVVRKRSQDGKPSDVYIHQRKYTKRERQKEIARHVPLGQDWYGTEDVRLPSYVTVCTPSAEAAGHAGLPDMGRDFLLRDLPYLQLTETLQSLAGRFQGIVASSTLGASLQLTMRDLSVPGNDSTFIRMGGAVIKDERDVNKYFPPGDLAIKDSSSCDPNARHDNFPFSILKTFLLRFLFLSANNIFDQQQFNKVSDRIVEQGGTDILVRLCQIRSASMEVFKERLFNSAVMSGNTTLGRKILECGLPGPEANSFYRQRWADYLCIAVYHGHEDMVELLCEAGACPELNRYWAWTDSWDSRLPILHTLLAFGASPERLFTKQEPGYALVSAAFDGSLEAVRLLLGKGARVNLCLPRYYGTALQAACFRGHLELVKYLVQNGADIDVPDKSQIEFPDTQFKVSDYNLIPLLTPIQIAAKMNNNDLIYFLSQHGSSAMAVPASAHPGIEHFTQKGAQRQRRGRQLSQHRWKDEPDINGLIYSALQFAVLNQNLEIVNLLLAMGVPPDSRAIDEDDTPLQISARMGNVKVSQLLLTWGADLNCPPSPYGGRTALQGAAESGSLEVLIMLLRAGAQINAPAGAEYGMTALQSACLGGHCLIAGILLSHGADLTIIPSPVAGLTPLQAAAVHGDMKLVEDLITLDAKVNAPATEWGTTALLAVIEHRALPLLELLVQHGAYINATDKYRMMSPLNLAARRDWLNGLQFLLQHGANVNDTPLDPELLEEDTQLNTEYLMSPLGWAIYHESENIISMLLEHGADVLATASLDRDFLDGESALVYALKQQSGSAIIDMLLSEVSDLRSHPGWEDTLGIVLNNSIESDTNDNIMIHDLILEKVRTLPPLLRQEVIQRAWDKLPGPNYSYGDIEDDEESLLEVTELLMNLGVPLECLESQPESTLLQRSARDGHEKLCLLLINRGAAVNGPATKFYGTPLQEAIRKSHMNLATTFLENGADINALPARYRGVTALQAASINGLFELAVRLLESGADVSAPAAPEYGRTAINGAAERGQFDMVKMLLNAYAGQGFSDADLEPIRREAAGYAEEEQHYWLARRLRGG